MSGLRPVVYQPGDQINMAGEVVRHANGAPGAALVLARLRAVIASFAPDLRPELAAALARRVLAIANVTPSGQHHPCQPAQTPTGGAVGHAGAGDPLLGGVGRQPVPGPHAATLGGQDYAPGTNATPPVSCVPCGLGWPGPDPWRQAVDAAAALAADLAEHPGRVDGNSGVTYNGADNPPTPGSSRS